MSEHQYRNLTLTERGAQSQVLRDSPALGDHAVGLGYTDRLLGLLAGRLTSSACPPPPLLSPACHPLYPSPLGKQCADARTLMILNIPLCSCRGKKLPGHL